MIDKGDAVAQRELTISKKEVQQIYGMFMCFVSKFIAHPLDGLEYDEGQEKTEVEKDR